jgi:hypothetical protein
LEPAILVERQWTGPVLLEARNASLQHSTERSGQTFVVTA